MAIVATTGFHNRLHCSRLAQNEKSPPARLSLTTRSISACAIRESTAKTRNWSQYESVCKCSRRCFAALYCWLSGLNIPSENCMEIGPALPHLPRLSVSLKLGRRRSKISCSFPPHRFSARSRVERTQLHIDVPIFGHRRPIVAGQSGQGGHPVFLSVPPSSNVAVGLKGACPQNWSPALIEITSVVKLCTSVGDKTSSTSAASLVIVKGFFKTCRSDSSR